MRIVLSWTLVVLFAGAVAALAQTEAPPGDRHADQNSSGGATAGSNQTPLPPALPATLPAAPAPSEVPVPLPPPISTSEPSPLPATQPAASEPASAPAPAVPQSRSGQLKEVVVSADLDRQREQIAPALGAGTYTIGQNQIEVIPGGANAPFQQVLLRNPGVVEDSFGQVHLRGEHSNLTYRVNGVLLPASIISLAGFGGEVDTHAIDSVTLIDGSLPAQFGFRTAGIVDIATKSGATLDHSEVGIYGGSFDTLTPSFATGGHQGGFDYFLSGSYRQTGLGIENPAGTPDPTHDFANQGKTFGYFAWQLDPTSRLSVLLNGSYGHFQIPDVSGNMPSFTVAGLNNPNSAVINETQDEQDYYSAISYQKTADQLSFLVAAFSRYGQIKFNPDPPNDLAFSGVSSAITNSFLTNGLQFDAAYVANEEHTLRFGFLGDYTSEILNANNLAFPVDATGAQTSTMPNAIISKGGNWGDESAVYLQDEWKIAKPLTLNYGARFDRFDASFDHENQVSPRVNLVWKASKDTTIHAGYAWYFQPPPVQYTGIGVVQQFANTSNAPSNFRDDKLKVERSNYFDIGFSQQLNPAWQVTLDGFYKGAKPLLDSGQFGNAIILAPFNYAKGRDYGGEFSTTFKEGGWSAYANFAFVDATGENITSSQYLFGGDELAFIANHFIKLDHNSTITVSAGTSYAWTNNRVYVDFLYGSGLRRGFANTQHEPAYYPVNVGFEHVFHPDIRGLADMRFRFDIVNVFDQVYQLRNGTGVGVGAPQFGERRGFFAGLTFDF